MDKSLGMQAFLAIQDAYALMAMSYEQILCPWKRRAIKQFLASDEVGKIEAAIERQYLLVGGFEVDGKVAFERVKEGCKYLVVLVTKRIRERG